MRLRKLERPYVWGHRGASGYAPENTLESFRLAREMGCDGCELDVQMSKDGQLVVIHDETIDRTSNGHGWVKDLTFEQLRQYNYNAVHPEYEYCQIPTLEEVLRLYQGTDEYVNIELKTNIISYPGIVDKVLQLVHDLQMEDQIIYSSFNHRHCVEIREKQPDAYVGFLYQDGYIDVIDYVKAHGGSALHPALFRIEGEEYVRKAYEAGLDINTWTVNQPEHMEMACRMHITTIITNYPDKAMEIVAR